MGGQVQGQGRFLYSVDYIYMCSAEIQTDTGKPEPHHVWGVTAAADSSSHER